MIKKLCIVACFDSVSYFQWYVALQKCASKLEIEVSSVNASPVNKKWYNNFREDPYWQPLREADYVFVYCFDEETEILTKNGFKKYDEIEINDLIYTLNKDTEEIELKPINNIYIYDYKGDMIHFKGRSYDLLVTPNHKMVIRPLYKDHNKLHKIILEDAKRTASRSYYKIPNGKWKGKNQEKIFIDKKEYLMSDVCYLMGLFIGDGFSYKRKWHSADIGLCIPRTDKSREKVENIFKKMGIKYHGYKNEIHFYSDKFAEFFGECGKGAHNKCIPKWVLDLDVKYLEKIFEGLMDSDGCKNRVYSTVSRKLVDDFTQLCMKLSMRSTSHIVSQTSFIRGKCVKSSRFDISVSKRERWLGKVYNTSKYEKYKGKIWCPEVDNHIIYVRRNGRSCWSGNCTRRSSRNEPSGLSWWTLPMFVKALMKPEAKMIAQYDDEFVWLFDPLHVWWDIKYMPNPQNQGPEQFFKETGILEVSDAYLVVRGNPFPEFTKYTTKPVFKLLLPQLFRYKLYKYSEDHKGRNIAILLHSPKNSSIHETLENVIRPNNWAITLFTGSLDQTRVDELHRKEPLPMNSGVYARMNYEPYMDLLWQDCSIGLDDNVDYKGWSRFAMECTIAYIPCVGSTEAVQDIYPELYTAPQDYTKQVELISRLKTDKVFYHKTAQDGHKRMLDLFDNEKLCRALLDIFYKVETSKSKFSYNDIPRIARKYGKYTSDYIPDKHQARPHP